MNIKFVNHSSYIVQHDGVNLICDPWLEGRVFNNGWDLISETRLKYGDFADITHIWFSHEHPDHFSPPNLKNISPEHRQNIIVLFQETGDKRVVDFCRKFGFKEVIELKPDEWVSLSTDFEILCEYYAEGDSWAAFKSKSCTVLNTNDCGIRHKNRALEILKKVGKVDVLTTQFSYAFWAGNRDQIEYRRKLAAEKLDGLKFQVDIFNPVVTIPIASFIWFCHEENFYLNDEINRPQRVYDFIKENTKSIPVVLYSGDEYKFGDEHDSTSAIERYNRDFESLKNTARLEKTKQADLTAIIEQSKKFAENLRTEYGIYARFLKPAKIFLTDYDRSFELNLESGLVESSYKFEDSDVALGSESLAYCFKFPWGTDTLQINGRLQKPTGGNYTNFYNFFRFDQLKSRDVKVDWKYIAGHLTHKVATKLGLSSN
ncbi:MAG: MBL fold metallo-hydrolase [Acidobacteriota bacterium]|nr:MBL fold metallo-hydrolase [Acidobacteriota bacterium]